MTLAQRCYDWSQRLGYVWFRVTHGHDFVPCHAHGRQRLQCWKCGYETVGWTIREISHD